MTKRIRWIVLVSAVFAACLLGGCSNEELIQQPASHSDSTSASVIHKCTAEPSAGYYRIDTVFENQANIIYIDFAEQKEIFLCEQPGCSHQTDSCRSYLPLDEDLAIPALYTVGDHLVFMQTAASETKPAHILIANLDGSERRQLAEFPGNYVLSTSLFTDDSFLYLTVDVNEPETAESTKEIISVNLKDGTIKELYSYPKNVPTPYIAGALQQYLVMASLLTDSEGAMFLEYRLFDIEDSEMRSEEFALCDIQSTGSFIDGELLYEIDYANKMIRTTSVLTGQKNEVNYSSVFDNAGISDSNHKVAVFPVDGSLLRIEILPSAEHDDFREFLFDMQSGESCSFTLLKDYNQDVITLMAKFGDSYLVCKDWIMSNGSDSQGMPQIKFVPQYALIRAEDYRASNDRCTPILSEVYPSAWNE